MRLGQVRSAAWLGRFPLRRDHELKTHKIFLASSSELLDDRKEFQLFIARKCNDWVPKGVHLEVVVWEDFLDAVSRTRLQDEYNEAIRECDLFVMLFFTKVGKYTEEEFETAFKQFKATDKPFLFTYFKDAQINTGSVNRADLMSLLAFQDKLDALGHFYTRYENVQDLLLKFNRQLDKLAANGFIEFAPDKGDSPEGGGDTYQATLTGNGAIAQGPNATAVGAGGVIVRGGNNGPINTGTQIHLDKHISTEGGAVVHGGVQTRGGHFIGRDFFQTITQVVHAGEDPDEANSVIAAYLQALAAELAGLKLGEIDASADQSKQQPLQLADIYVPLDTTMLLPEDMPLPNWHALELPERRKMIDFPFNREVRLVSALEALAAHRELTLLGKPGSGKSTFGASVLLSLAQAWQGHGEELAKLGETWPHGALLPIRVILRRFAEQLPPGDQPARAGDLWTFIGADLQASGYGLSGRAMEYVQRLARNQGALILFDGLDECGDGARRERVLAAVRDLIHSAGPKCRFLLTARPYAWPGGADPTHGVYELADLNQDQIAQFIRAWYAALATRQWLSPGEAERKCADLLQAHERPDLLPLAQNPLLLTLMASLHTSRGRLPDDRADLYNESVDLLLLRWNRQIGADKALLDELAVPGLKLSDLREVLEELAFKVHGENVGREGTADIGEDRLGRAFCPLLGGSRDKASVVVTYVEKRAGLLMGQGEKDGERQFTFPHRTFQEFLAACHLASKGDFVEECGRLARHAPAHWQVVLPLAARLAKAERGASAADQLVGGRSVVELRDERRPEPADWICARLAALQLVEIGASALNKSERTRAIKARVADWLVASLPVLPDQGGLPASERAQAGDVLAQLGDPRRYLLDVDHLRFALVPAGPFWMGEEGDEDAPLHRNEGLDYDYWIAQTPVTVAQFRQFVEASGYSDFHADAVRDPDNRPVTSVSSRDAQAFCAWLTDRWRERLPSGASVALPSEAEWEKAARGGESTPVEVRIASIHEGFVLAGTAHQANPLPKRAYPWGDESTDDRANWKQDIGSTTTPGCFEAGASPYGCQDMAGNVWEWMRSLWGSDWEKPEFPYPYDARDQRREDPEAAAKVLRVLRGGSWNLLRDFARCAFRLRDFPDSRVDDLGFRVVLRVSPVS
jgi:formylglycine-generating enzyme required for sulfatase activity